MEFGYARILENQQQDSPMMQQLLKLVPDDRFVFSDVRSKDYERKNYDFMCNMLRAGDVLYIDGLDSLGSTFEEIAQEWQMLTRERNVDVVVLESAGALDSRKFHSMGELGKQLEGQMLYLLGYMGELQQRGSNNAAGDGKKVGRPSLDWNWDLFDATAQRWADGEISLEEACDIMNSARSSWYKYAKERGFTRSVNRRGKK